MLKNKEHDTHREVLLILVNPNPSRRRFLKIGLSGAVVAVVSGIGAFFAMQQPQSVSMMPAIEPKAIQTPEAMVTHMEVPSEPSPAFVYTPTIVLKSAPTSSKIGDKLHFVWEIMGGGSITHTAVHWDTKPGIPSNFKSYGKVTPEFAKIDSPHEAPMMYEVTIDAPEAETIYYVIHAIVDGEHIYLPGGEHMISISPSETSTPNVVVEETLMPGEVEYY